ncbi:MAG TPA: PAS domain-containing sensor histidine kinase, partial [Clostridiales bacterium]|nr:PAS domain-containing sensor histidine kinase [Clostridiales bacterium]
MGKDLNEGEINKSALLDNLPSMVYRCNFDRDWTMQFVSDASFELTGYKAESLIGNRDLCFNDIIAPEYREYLWIR